MIPTLIIIGSIKDILNHELQSANQIVKVNVRSHKIKLVFNDLPSPLNRALTFSFSDLLPSGEYDFIIVGSGSAGSVLANRLSANPDWQILLIEAGDVETLMHQIPLFAAHMQTTASNWNYAAEPQVGVCLGK